MQYAKKTSGGRRRMRPVLQRQVVVIQRQSPRLPGAPTVDRPARDLPILFSARTEFGIEICQVAGQSRSRLTTIAVIHDDDRLLAESDSEHLPSGWWTAPGP